MPVLGCPSIFLMHTEQRQLQTQQWVQRSASKNHIERSARRQVMSDQPVTFYVVDCIMQARCNPEASSLQQLIQS